MRWCHLPLAHYRPDSCPSADSRPPVCLYIYLLPTTGLYPSCSLAPKARTADAAPECCWVASTANMGFFPWSSTDRISQSLTSVTPELPCRIHKVYAIALVRSLVLWTTAPITPKHDALEGISLVVIFTPHGLSVSRFSPCESSRQTPTQAPSPNALRPNQFAAHPLHDF